MLWCPMYFAIKIENYIYQFIFQARHLRTSSRIIIRFIFHWPMKIYIILSVIYLRKWSIESSMTLSNHDHQPHFSLSSSPTIRFVVIAPFIGPHYGGWRHHFSYILSFSFYPNLAEWTYDSRSMVKRNNKSIRLIRFRRSTA